MERSFDNADDYMYGGYRESLSEGSHENNPNTSNDILQNFPYLRHGLNFGSQQGQVSSSSVPQNPANTPNYKTAGYQQAFPSISSRQVPDISLVPPEGSLHMSSHGMLPSVATFTTALSQSTLPSHFHQSTSNTCEIQGESSNFPQNDYRYHATASPRAASQTNTYSFTQTTTLPGFQNLVSASKELHHRSLYPVRCENNGLRTPSSSEHMSKTNQYFESARSTHIKPSNHEPNQNSSSYSQEATSSSNFDNLVNHAVKMAPVEISNEIQENVKDNISRSERHSKSRISTKHTNQLSDVQNQRNVKFYLKGRLSDNVTSMRSRGRLPESFAMEDSYEEYGVKDTIPEVHTDVSGSMASNDPTQYLDNIYKEPSLADIRASIDKLDNDNHTMIQNDSIKVENADAAESIDSGLLQRFSLGGEGNTHESWYSSALRRFGEVGKEDDPNTYELCAKKGGRSDPENPFAITSPSFSESAARALMTTTNSATATTVRISIMSIGSRKKLLPNIVNSQAAQGGILSVVNPVDSEDELVDSNDPEVKSEKTSIMSKLKRDRQDKLDQQEDELDTEIDRLDIDIKIDDDQYVGEGSQKRWQCKICPKSYTTKHNLLAHILDHSSIKPHLCLVCGKYFKQLSHLNTHMLTHDHVKPYKCKVCEKGFTQISHLKRHETVHLESKPYICDVCKRGFAFPSELRIHKDKHIFGKEKCTDCDKEFNTVDELKEHMVTEKHGDELTCKHCQRMFKYPSQLRDHMTSHGGARPFICTECGMDFMKEHHLRAHLFTHTGLRPFSCPHCHRSFNQKANMVRHMLIHDSQRAFKCEICSKTFTQPQTLKAHMVVHSDKKPYSCRFCGKQFGRQHNLQGHLHMHMDSKPYVCSICQSSFTLKGNLNRHKKVKHGLNESTENMEEDAVNFLSSLSDRTRDVGSPENDTFSQEDPSTPDGKSSKKTRKSTPKKHIAAKAFGVENGDENDSNLVSYSDEERENEERLSKYFIKAEEEDENGGTSQKGPKAVLYKNTAESDEDEDTEIDQEFEAETENDSVIVNKGKGDLKSVNDSAAIDKNGFGSRIQKASVNMHNLGPEKRSTRKRKKKELDEDFLDFDENLGEEEYVDKTPKKNVKRKGAMLDTLIASKFKKV